MLPKNRWVAFPLSLEDSKPETIGTAEDHLFHIRKLNPKSYTFTNSSTQRPIESTDNESIFQQIYKQRGNDRNSKGSAELILPINS